MVDYLLAAITAFVKASASQIVEAVITALAASFPVCLGNGTFGLDRSRARGRGSFDLVLAITAAIASTVLEIKTIFDFVAT